MIHRFLFKEKIPSGTFVNSRDLIEEYFLVFSILNMSVLPIYGGELFPDLGMVGMNAALEQRTDRPSLGSIVASILHQTVHYATCPEEWACLECGDFGVSFLAIEWQIFLNRVNCCGEADSLIFFLERKDLYCLTNWSLILINVRDIKLDLVLVSNERVLDFCFMLGSYVRLPLDLLFYLRFAEILQIINRRSLVDFTITFLIVEWWIMKIFAFDSLTKTLWVLKRPDTLLFWLGDFFERRVLSKSRPLDKG